MRKDIAIIAAVELELSVIGAFLGAGELRFHEPVKKGNVILCLSGIGMVNAAIATTRIIDLYAPSLIISTGVCGAYNNSGLRIGDIAMAEEEIYGDTGLNQGEDFQDLKAIGLPVMKRSSSDSGVFNEIPVNNPYKERISEICTKLGLKLGAGRFVTVAGIAGDFERARILEMRWNAICENMEGAGVAHAAFLNNIDFMEIRGVSNIAGERDKKRWDIKLASENCQKVLLRFIEMEAQVLPFSAP